MRGEPEHPRPMKYIDEQTGAGASAPSEEGVIDTGLLCLAMLARYHQVAVDVDQLAYEFRGDAKRFGMT